MKRLLLASLLLGAVAPLLADSVLQTQAVDPTNLPVFNNGQFNVPLLVDFNTGAAIMESPQAQDVYITGAAAQSAQNNNVILATAGSGSTDTMQGTPAYSYRYVYIEIVGSSGIGAGTVVFEQSNDNANWISLYLANLNTGTPQNGAGSQVVAASTNYWYGGNVLFRYIRARISVAFTGGTIHAFTRLSSSPSTYPILNTIPTRVATRVISAVPAAALAAGTELDFPGSIDAQLIVHQDSDPTNEETATAGTTGLNSASSTQLFASAGAGICHYVKWLHCYNTDASHASTITILNGAAILWTGHVPEGAATTDGKIEVTFSPPLKGSAATVLNIQCGTACNLLYYNVGGYKSN